MTFYAVFIPVAALLISAPFVMLWHLWWLSRKKHCVMIVGRSTGTSVTVQLVDASAVEDGLILEMLERHLRDAGENADIILLPNWQRFYP